MRQIILFLATMLFCCCSADSEAKAETPTMNKIYITIGEQTQSVTLVDNDAQRQQFRNMGFFRQIADNEKRADDSPTRRHRAL